MSGSRDLLIAVRFLTFIYHVCLMCFACITDKLNIFIGCTSVYDGLQQVVWIEYKYDAVFVKIL